MKEEIANKMATNKEEKSALSPRQYTLSQVNRNDGKTTWIALWIASAPHPHLYSPDLVPQQLLAVFRHQKNAPGKDLAPMKKWYQKLRPKTNCSTKRYRIVREALKSVDYFDE